MRTFRTFAEAAQVIIIDPVLAYRKDATNVPCQVSAILRQCPDLRDVWSARCRLTPSTANSKQLIAFQVMDASVCITSCPSRHTATASSSMSNRRVRWLQNAARRQ